MMAAIALNTRAKYEQLLDMLRSYGRMAVAFSGGTDSALLAFAAHRVLADDALALTADTGLSPQSELDGARSFCERYGIQQLVVPTHQLENPAFDPAADDRCYVCKLEMMGTLLDVAHEHGIQVLADGTNIDDDPAHRPGMRALAELGVSSPLRTAGLTKDEIRAISRDLGLPTADKKAFSCLAVRGQIELDRSL